MSTTPGAPDLEARLRVALAARADLVRGEDLAPLATATPVRRRWPTPWVLLAAAAVVLLVLGVVLQGVGGRTRSDEVAPEPDAPQLELPADVGRDWKADDLSSPARLDLDGDGRKERVDFLAEPTEDFDGRVRLQTTVSTTGEQAYGIAELGTTIGTSALDPIDADGDGDQELVLYFDDPSAVGGGGYPLVFDLRDGLLVRAVVEDPELLVRGSVPVDGSATEHFRMVHLHDYWFEQGTLWSSRSVNAYAEGNMTLLRPETIVVDAWRWALGDDGVLRHVEEACLRQGLEASQPCGNDTENELPSIVPVAGETIGAGGRAVFDVGYRYTVSVEAGDPATLVVRGEDGRTLRHDLAVADARVSTTQPTSVMSDGASFYVTSASDPSYAQVLVQDGDRLRALDTTGDVELTDDATTRTWLTAGGALVTAVAEEEGAWRAWQWQMVSGAEMAALPSGTVCFDDPSDPATVRRC
ncbi:hypothetical protein GCM10009641_29580 [Mycobacterium cookii]|uniref:VCBS repeat-containing protein n=1 Tax=Nocardioides furvisabuli TaxID=375542 RepID=A0ABP5J7Y9_9ACTN|nr:hypothetical protein [Nocardioides furvisabuli]